MLEADHGRRHTGDRATAPAVGEHKARGVDGQAVVDQAPPDPSGER
jgi:hypothetical protein